jgi:hypothetical protein
MVRPGECSGNGEAGLLSRRQMLRRGAALALTVPSAAALLEACGSSSSSSGTGSQAGSLAGTAHMENYPDCMGTHVVPAFQQLHPGSLIKQTTNSSSSISGTVQQLKTGSFDFGLADVSATQQAVDIGLVQPPDWSKIPIITYVGQSFRTAYPHGIPTDYGKIGIGYRPDLVGEKITSWHDVWRLAPKFSGKIVFIDLDRDCMGPVAARARHRDHGRADAAGVDAGLRAAAREPPEPARTLGDRARVAVAERGRPAPPPRRLHPARPAAAPRTLRHRGAQQHGLDAGDWDPMGAPADLPPDQRAEDGLALSFTSAPLGEPVEILGQSAAVLALAADRRWPWWRSGSAMSSRTAAPASSPAACST